METQTGSNRKLSSDRRVFNIISVVLLSLLTLFCTLPFWLILSGSFTSQDSILTDGYRLLPKIFSLEAYQFLFKAPEDMLHAYGVTIFVTAVGTFSSMCFQAEILHTVIPFPFSSILQRFSEAALYHGIFSI